MNASVDQTYKIIDCDTHLTEPHDLWISRAPAKWKDLVPQVKNVDGKPHWVYEGDQILATTRASSVIRPDLSKGYGTVGLNFTYDMVHPASYDIKERVKFMDQTGTWAQLLYPNLMGFSGLKAPGKDPKLKTVCVQIYNEALAEFQEQSGQRLFGMALLPWWNIDETVAEIKRCHEMGLRGVNTNPNPQQQGFPGLAEDAWAPVLDLCGEIGMPINFHIGASEQSIDWMGTQGWPSLTRDLYSGIQGAMIFFNNGKVVSNLIYSGLLDRFEKLKFVSVESGIGWVPFLMQALDYQLKEIAETKSFNKKPSEYFKSNFYACFWFEKKDISDMLHKVGIDNCLFETDFPHPTSLYPIDNLEQRLSSLTQEDRTKVLSTNAAKLYNIAI